MKVAISNFSRPVRKKSDFRAYWRSQSKPPRGNRLSLFEYKADWGFHIYALGVYLMDKGVADEAEFWDFSEQRSTAYHPYGVLNVTFFNEADLKAYLERYGCPDLYIHHGGVAGHSILRYLKGKCFTVYVPALRYGYRFERLIDRMGNFRASCYLVDSEEYLDDRSMLYVPVVNTEKIRPREGEKKRDFIYLARNYGNKRHDIIIDALRGRNMTGHFHPVDASKLDLNDTHITASDWNEADVVELLATSRIAVYPGDYTSNPAAMWECVAAGLPIVVNKNIKGGKHLVVPGVTGEFASEDTFYEVMQEVLANRARYRPREYFMENWDTVRTLEKYLAFFNEMGWRA
jgi:glycosyltransferase involved in cell wall biosynthesis